MIAFNAAQFIVDYPQFATYSATTLTNNYYNQALTLGAKILGLFNNSTPSQTWDASINEPTLVNGTSEMPYLCIVAGTVDFGAGNIIFAVNDVASYDIVTGLWSNIGYPSQYYWACQVLAHIMQLTTTMQVGRVSHANEGSITGAFAYDDSKNGAWWNQTTYGAMCWQLIKQRGGFTYYPQASYNGYPVSNNCNGFGAYI